ncbi:hypothetical_protein [Leishmania infantum]|uniref:Uncharacterized protein n=2 Tax=Leishmania donovani species complex TaxID=38574 RepID=A0A3S7WR69_LEIDO|nr:hypothetical protein LdCL_100012400 [Leishmania donovani]CAC9457568.1 hypothetical_protein [Leishmania infantum]SUZ39688.1 hypothetical_protein [Leishmania infantum]
MPLFTGFNFNTASFQKCVPEKTGDGGICIGHLIFRKDMEVLASKLIDEIREDQSWLRESGYFSVGGPCIGLPDQRCAPAERGGLSESLDMCELHQGAMGRTPRVPGCSPW